MAKYDYIKVRVNEDERKLLEEMVGDNGFSSLSDAVRKLAFDKQMDYRFVLLGYLSEVSVAQHALSGLIRSGITKGEIVEADVVEMEREIRKMQRSAAKLARELRRAM